jgi:hypothetical protein
MNHWNIRVHVLVPPWSSAIQRAYLHADDNEITVFRGEPELSLTMVKELPLTA